MADNSGLSFRWLRHDNSEQIQRLDPVILAFDPVFALLAQRQHSQCRRCGHIHRSLGGFRHRQDIVPDCRWESIYGKGRKCVLGERDRRLPLWYSRFVVFCRRDISRMLFHLFMEELKCALPGAVNLLVRQRRRALGHYFHKLFVSLRCITPTLQNLSCCMGDGAVSAAFRDKTGPGSRSRLLHVRHKFVFLQFFNKICQRPVTLEDIDFRIRIAIEEPAGIQRLLIEEREKLLYLCQ